MLQRSAPRLVLASASASRRALLDAAGLAFTVSPADIDEAVVKRQARREGLDATDAALRLADHKAATVAQRMPEALVIGADQILVCDGIWYDKPGDTNEARQQLRALRGRRHVLATAVVCRLDDARVWHHVAVPALSVRGFSDDFLDGYLAAEAEAVTSTVGAYRLEGRGVQLFGSIEGDHSAVLGLPLLPLLAFLRRTQILIE